MTIPTHPDPLFHFRVTSREDGVLPVFGRPAETAWLPLIGPTAMALKSMCHVVP